MTFFLSSRPFRRQVALRKSSGYIIRPKIPTFTLVSWHANRLPLFSASYRSVAKNTLSRASVLKWNDICRTTTLSCLRLFALCMPEPLTTPYTSAHRGSHEVLSTQLRLRGLGCGHGIILPRSGASGFLALLPLLNDEINISDF